MSLGTIAPEQIESMGESPKNKRFWLSFWSLQFWMKKFFLSNELNEILKPNKTQMNIKIFPTIFFTLNQNKLRLIYF